MKTSGYKFGNKNHWRKWLWNRICERVSETTVEKSDAVVVYLAGEEDLDRDVALRKGFRFNNLIAVDKSRKVIECLKKKKVPCLYGEISDVVEAFNNSKEKIDVLICDYCHGVNGNVSKFVDKLTSSNFDNSFGDSPIIAMNFMRGRDSGEIIDFRNNRRESFASVFDEEKKEWRDPNAKDMVHRGEVFMDYMIEEHVMPKMDKKMIKKFGGEWNYKDFMIYVLDMFGHGDLFPEEWERQKLHRDIDSYEFHMNYTYNHFSPRFHSYRSGNIYMDSVIFTYDTSTMGEDLVESAPNKKLSRSLAATLAVRTMRESGQL